MVEMVQKDNESRFDIWSSIQKDEETKKKRSSCLMSQQSLELCTESLGSETGADEFSSADELDPFFSPSSKSMNIEAKGCFSSKTYTSEDKEEELEGRKEQIRVNHYHTFPPSLSSSSIQMRSTRREGRLILEAIIVPSHNHLHAERHEGRLLLTFVNPPNIQSNIISLFYEQKSTEKDVDDDNDDVDDDEYEYNGEVEGKEEDKLVAPINDFKEMFPNKFDCNVLQLKYNGKWNTQATSTVEVEELICDIKDFCNREDFLRCHLRSSWTEIIK